MQRKKELVRVAATPLGRGVIAQRMIRRNQTIGYIDGQLIQDPDYGSDYCIDLGAGYRLEPTAPFRYLNHCCEPNAEVYCWDEEAGDGVVPTAWVAAIRTIRPGDEVTIDYGWSAEVAIRCGCGAATCRGWVVSDEELAKLKRSAEAGVVDRSAGQ